ncbi:hypothetical protein WN944_006294 [Citrus x changshan-huyou]|uniref:MLO-like protein n=1 Tax=Citrus x changshan-huyou TaxID=2935761 RepID=A0AAP0ML26_9ROSI
MTISSARSTICIGATSTFNGIDERQCCSTICFAAFTTACDGHGFCVNGDERNGGGVNKARKVSSGDSNLHCCFSYHSVNFCLFSCSTGNLQIWKVVEDDNGIHQKMLSKSSFLFLNESDVPPNGIINNHKSHQCGEGHEPFVSLEGLEQLHRFLFVLGITHVLYSCLAVGLAMSKLCFLRQFKSSIRKSDYLAQRLGFLTKHKRPLSYNFHNYIVRSMEDEFHGILGISYPLWGYAILCIFVNIHGLNIYFWLSFIPAILVMVVGTKLQHVVSSLALEIMEQTGPSVRTQVKPRDDLFWFRKPEILLRLIQFIIFQNTFEMATFIWSLFLSVVYIIRCFGPCKCHKLLLSVCLVGISGQVMLHEKPLHDHYSANLWFDVYVEVLQLVHLSDALYSISLTPIFGRTYFSTNS